MSGRPQPRRNRHAEHRRQGHGNWEIRIRLWSAVDYHDPRCWQRVPAVPALSQVGPLHEGVGKSALEAFHCFGRVAHQETEYPLSLDQPLRGATSTGRGPRPTGMPHSCSRRSHRPGPPPTRRRPASRCHPWRAWWAPVPHPSHGKPRRRPATGRLVLRDMPALSGGHQTVCSHLLLVVTPVKWRAQNDLLSRSSRRRRGDVDG